ncbi:MAG: pyridoxamine 5'-phosphate oxidase family protein [Halieaceae bacterium]
MTQVTADTAAEFFTAVSEASNKADWAAVANVVGDEPRVRMVHPTWEGETLWFATSTDSAKAQQLRENPNIDVQFQVSPPEFVHIMARGKVEFPTDAETRQRVWDLLTYDLADFWPNGVDDPDYIPVKIVCSRVELSEMFGTMNKRVWRPA